MLKSFFWGFFWAIASTIGVAAATLVVCTELEERIGVE